MLRHAGAKKVTVYVGGDVHHHGEPLYLAVLNYLFRHGMSGATVIKGVAGFGSHHRMHTARILDISENLPITIEFIDESAKVDAILPALVDMVSHGLIEVQDTTIVSGSGGAQAKSERP
jgi:PII-like signaling protein